MNETDQAFYDLTVAQRNQAWHEVEQLRSKVEALTGHLAKYEAAVRETIEEQSWSYVSGNGHDSSQWWEWSSVGTEQIDEFFVDLQRNLG